MKKFSLLGIAAAGVLFASSAFGQIFIEQGKIKRNVNPGQTLTGEIGVHNTTNQQAAVRVYWEDFVYVAPFDGSKKFLPAGSTGRSAVEWVQFTDKEFVLPAFGKKRVKYSIRIPDDARGGYYGVLFFEDAGEKRQVETGVRLVSRVGSLFFLETNDRKKITKVSDVRADDGKIKGTITNQGNAIVLAKGIYYVMSADGFVADRGELKKVYLPPSEKADVVIPVAPELQAGRYSVVLTFDLEEGDSSVKEIDLIKHPGSTIEIKQLRD
jgi:hypothetical protein